jgi:hypothetical protein
MHARVVDHHPRTTFHTVSPRTPVNRGKREARSPQSRKAERVLSWCEAAGGATMNMLTVGGNSDEDE